MKDLYRLLPEEMEQLVVDMGYPRYRADQILLPLYYKFPKNINDIPQLPKKLREELSEAGYTIGSAKEVHRIVSDDGEVTKFLIDHLSNLDNLVQLLDDPVTKAIEQRNMHAICNKSKVIIIDTRDECPYDNEIAIDRAHLMILIKAWQNLLAQKPVLITLQKNDDYITLIGTFGKDKPEYKANFSYRPGHLD